jgi:GNAT superfamily N-acetyltransferase
MIEVRTIQPNETEAFLQLLSDAFAIDPNRARRAFYSDPFFDLNRKWALFDHGQMRSILTTTPLLFGWGRAFGIAGVATQSQFRGQGYGKFLLESVLRHGQNVGEPTALLFAHQTTVYERCGFTLLDHVISGTIRLDGDPGHARNLDIPVVQQKYTAWSERSVNRLRRDERRWRYWSWVYRPCEPFGDGYICHEPNLCREAIPGAGQTVWPVPPNTRWLGLRSLTDALGVPLTDQREEMMLMGYQVPGAVEMFMTDQF